VRRPSEFLAPMFDQPLSATAKSSAGRLIRGYDGRQISGIAVTRSARRVLVATVRPLHKGGKRCALPPTAPATVRAPPAMAPGPIPNVQSESGTPGPSQASSPTRTAMRPSPHLGLLVAPNLRLELHVRQRRPERLRFALHRRQRHDQTECHCQEGAIAAELTVHR